MAIEMRGSRKFVMIMAASAAMIVAGAGTAWAQDATQDTSSTGTLEAPPPNGLAMVNQVQSLRDQMQQMQGQIEMLQHRLQQLEQADKDRFTDLDGRVGKLEHATPSTSAPAAQPVASAPANSAPAASAAAPAASSSPPSAADQAAAQAAYDAAFKALRTGNYVDSARGFRAFIDKYPQSPLVANAWYWLGGSYSITQNYKPALAAYQTLLRQFPGSSKAADAQLRMADCQIALKDYHAARATLHAVIKAHRGTPLARRAQDKLREIPIGAGGG